MDLVAGKIVQRKEVDDGRVHRGGVEAFDARVSAAKVVSRVTAEPASDALYV